MDTTVRTPLFTLCLVALATLAGCSSLEDGKKASTLIPAKTLNVSESMTIPAEAVVAAAVAFLIVDPLAPNWWVEESKIGGDRFRIMLTKKRFTTGGDGEATQVFNRRAEELALASGSGRYRVVEFTEGVESHTLIARRVARGVVEILP